MNENQISLVNRNGEYDFILKMKVSNL